MEKEALINIILNDIKEIETLVNTFKGKNNIAKPFINLAKSKVDNIKEELTLLDHFSIEQIVSPEPQPANHADSQLIANSATTISQEEASVIPEKQEKREAKKEAPITAAPEKTVPPVPTPPPSCATDKVDIQMGQKPVIEETVKPAVETTPEQPKKKQAPKYEVPPQTEPSSEKRSESSIIGEKLGAGKRSLNDFIDQKGSDLSSKVAGKAITDIKKAIGINDRFFFQRELFNNNADMFNQTIDQLNQMADFDSALGFINANFNWNFEEEAPLSFLAIVKRKYL